MIPSLRSLALNRWDGTGEVLSSSLPIQLQCQRAEFPLIAACELQENEDVILEIVEWLVSKGSHINQTDDFSKTPLHFAVEFGYNRVAKFLIDNEANMSLVEGNGRTALHLAARAGNLEMVELLAYLNPFHLIDLTDRQGRTACDLATVMNHSKVSSFLKKYHGSIKSAFNYAMHTNNLQEVKVLLEKGVGFINKHSDGAMEFALEDAMYLGSVEMVQLLLDYVVNIGATNKDDDTPLHLAARYGHSEIALLLLEREANIGATNKYGDTPLHLAARYGHSETALLLLDRGANIDATNKSDNTPLHLAELNRHFKYGHWKYVHPEVVALLRSRGAKEDAGGWYHILRKQNIDIGIILFENLLH